MNDYLPNSPKWSKKIMDMSKEEIKNLPEEVLHEILNELKVDLDEIPDGEMKEQFKRLYEIAVESVSLIRVKKEAEEERNASKLARCITTLDNLKWESVEIMCRLIRLEKFKTHEELHRYADEFQERFIVEVEDEVGYDPWASESKEPLTPEHEMDELMKLKLQMNEAIAAEDYEKAAQLRDQIKERDK